ncbi:MAG: hypothetical protein ABIL11_03105 [Chloroflexota bacterium]
MGKKKETFDIAKNPLWPLPKRIPKDQRWFWTERWQQMERESQQDYESGNYYEFENVDDAIKFLNGEIEAKTVAEMEEEKDRGIR